MISVEQLRDFVSGHYTNAVLSGRMKDNKIELKLKMNSRERKKEYIHLYNVDIEVLRKNPSELVNYMITIFLETNTILGTNYFKEVPYHYEKNGFIFCGTDRTFSIALSNECMKLLPKDFVRRAEEKKREDIINFIKHIDVKKIRIDNYSQYTSGLSYDGMSDTFIYHPLVIRDKEGSFIYYKNELEFSKKLLSILIERGNVDFNELKKWNWFFKTGYRNSIYEYKLNDTIKYGSTSERSLQIFINFLNEYLSTHYDEVKEKQLILK